VSVPLLAFAGRALLASLVVALGACGLRRRRGAGLGRQRSSSV
jgi:hypothetical protein